MWGQAGFWDIDERYVRLSEAGDPQRKLSAPPILLVAICCFDGLI
jgi:hypothetical protein